MDERLQDPVDSLKELLEVTTKAGRRCAYDLSHAIDLIPRDDPFVQSLRERAELWLSIFNPANGPNDYRNSLHHEIFKLEGEIVQLR